MATRRSPLLSGRRTAWTRCTRRAGRCSTARLWMRRAEAGAVVRHGHHARRSDASFRWTRLWRERCSMPMATSMTIEADLVVGADGIGSSVARLPGAETVDAGATHDRGHLRLFSRHRADGLSLVVSGRALAPAPFRPIAVGTASSLRIAPERLRNGRARTTARLCSARSCARQILHWQP